MVLSKVLRKKSDTLDLGGIMITSTPEQRYSQYGTLLTDVRSDYHLHPGCS